MSYTLESLKSCLQHFLDEDKSSNYVDILDNLDSDPLEKEDLLFFTQDKNWAGGRYTHTVTPMNNHVRRFGFTMITRNQYKMWMIMQLYNDIQSQAEMMTNIINETISSTVGTHFGYGHDIMNFLLYGEKQEEFNKCVLSKSILTNTSYDWLSMTGSYGGRAYCCTCLYTTTHAGWPLHYVTDSSLKYHESDWAHMSSMMHFKGDKSADINKD